MKKNILRIILLLILPAGLFLGFNVRLGEAATYITSEDITNNTRWTELESPYIIQSSSFLVPDGLTLTIDPGVEVNFENSNINIEGALVADGTDDKKITFSSLDEGSHGGGIYFLNSNSNTKLNNVIVERLADGVYFDNTKLTISNFRMNDSLAGLNISNSNLNISNATFDGVYESIRLFDKSVVNVDLLTIGDTKSSDAIYVYKSTLNLSNSKIKDVYEGYSAVSLQLSTSSIKNTILEGGNKYGIYGSLSKLSMSSSSVQNFKEAGLSLTDVSAVITNSVISKNGIGIIEEVNAVVPDISFLDTIIRKFLNILGPSRAHADEVINSKTKIKIENSVIENNSIYGIKNSTQNIINATNNYWGDDSGPLHLDLNPYGIGNTVSNNVNFSPWITKSDSKLACCSSVLFIPALQATRLMKNVPKPPFGNISEEQLWEPDITGGNSEVKGLYLDASGKSIDPHIYTGEIIKKTNSAGSYFSKNVYASVSNEFDKLVNVGNIKEWKSWPYDWRMDLDEVVEKGMRVGKIIRPIISEIEQMASSSQTGKINIVAHSNGGLIAKELLNELKRLNKEKYIDQVILAAVPQLGTPKAIMGLLHGEGQELGGGFVLNKKTARALGENMQSAYNLLPSLNFFKNMDGGLINFSDKLVGLRSAYGATISTKEKLNDFLLGKEGRVKPKDGDTDSPNVLNSALLSNATQNHESLDKFSPASSTKVIQLAGWGRQTPNSISYHPTRFFGVNHSIGQIEDGDGTVVTKSASSNDKSLAESFYINLSNINEALKKNFDHTTFLEIPNVIEFVKNIVLGMEYNLTSGILLSKPKSSENTWLRASIHSPADIHVYDKNGNHTGPIEIPNQNTDIKIIEENIPNSTYEEIGEGKYITLDNKDAEIKIDGSGIGSFTLQLEVLAKNIQSDSEALDVIEFVDIPVTDFTEGELKWMPGLASTTAKLILDTNGDKKVDFVITPKSEVDPILFLEILKSNIKALKFHASIEKAVIQKIDKVIKSLTKEKISKSKDKLHKFNHKIANLKWSAKKITESQRLDLIKLINEVLDTL